MGKFTVHFMVPSMTWEGVEAEDEQEAIDKCPAPDYDPADGPYTYHVAREEDSDIDLPELCEFYPPIEEPHSGVCWAGSELGGTPCTKEYSETCENAQDRRAENLLEYLRDEDQDY